MCGCPSVPIIVYFSVYLSNLSLSLFCIVHCKAYIVIIIVRLLARPDYSVGALDSANAVPY